MPSWRACRRSPGCTPRSCAWSATPSSAPPGSWCWGRTPRSAMIAATIIPIVGANGDPQRAVALASMLALLVGGHDRARRHRQAGIRRRPAVQADPDRLHERARPHDLGGSAPQAVRLLGQCRRVHPRGGRLLQGAGRRRDGGGGARGRSARPGPHHRAPAAASKAPRRAGGRSRLDPGRKRLQPGRPRSLPGRPTPQGLPAVHAAERGDVRPGAAGGRRDRHRGRVAHRHDLDLLGVRGPDRPGGRREPGDDRDRRGQHRRRLLPGVPRQHQWLPHRGGRAGRGQDPGPGLVGAGAITLMLLVAPGLLRNLPQPTLAAVVIVASLSLADIPGTVRLWRQRRTEFMLSMAAFAGVALLGVLPGIAIAVALSIGNVFRRAWWPHQTVLGRVSGVPGYHDVGSYPDAEQLPGCVLFRFDAPLFVANARTFRDQVRRLARSEPRPMWIVVAAEPITDVDTTAADMLEDLDEALNAKGISLVFADMKDPVREKIERYELTRTIDPAHFFPTVGSAVAAFQEQFGADWTPAAGTQAR